jgi:hypothetical protein
VLSKVQAAEHLLLQPALLQWPCCQINYWFWLQIRQAGINGELRQVDM